jgi:hypothetical protein
MGMRDDTHTSERAQNNQPATDTYLPNCSQQILNPTIPSS